jgi:hypothetical protein
MVQGLVVPEFLSVCTFEVLWIGGLDGSMDFLVRGEGCREACVRKGRGVEKSRNDTHLPCFGFIL